MARQTFTKGQIVYCHRWGNVYKKAIVVRPDIVKAGLRTHYVGVRYIDAKGKPEGIDYPITNRANLILTEEAYNEIERAKTVAKLHSTIRAYAEFERGVLPYFDQAEIICRTLLNTVGLTVEPHDVNELAHYLRGMFTFKSSYSQLTRDGVRVLRREKRADASRARGELAAMGEEAPDLADEASA